MFGGGDTVREQLIKDGILPSSYDTNSCFCTFDIETINIPKEVEIGTSTIVHTEQTPVSIAITTETGDHFYFRETMDESSVTKMIEKFMEKLEELAAIHYAIIPKSVKDYYEQAKIEVLDKSTSVKNKQKIYRYTAYIRNLFKLKVVGFNSEAFDLPCIMKYILQNTIPSKVKTIKRGNKYFMVDIGSISFRDARNYLGPGSLSKLGKLYKVPEDKQLYPYELFQNVNEIVNQIQWPTYPGFKSTLGVAKSYYNEINDVISQFDSFGQMLEYYSMDNISFSAMQLQSPVIPDCGEDQTDMMKNFFTVSPIEYKKSKENYDEQIKNGTYINFLSYLKGRVKIALGFDPCSTWYIIDTRVRNFRKLTVKNTTKLRKSVWIHFNVSIRHQAL